MGLEYGVNIRENDIFKHLEQINIKAFKILNKLLLLIFNNKNDYITVKEELNLEKCIKKN